MELPVRGERVRLLLHDGADDRICGGGPQHRGDGLRCRHVLLAQAGGLHETRPRETQRIRQHIHSLNELLGWDAACSYERLRRDIVRGHEGRVKEIPDRDLLARANVRTARVLHVFRRNLDDLVERRGGLEKDEGGHQLRQARDGIELRRILLEEHPVAGLVDDVSRLCVQPGDAITRNLRQREGRSPA